MTKDSENTHVQITPTETLDSFKTVNNHCRDNLFTQERENKKLNTKLLPVNFNKVCLKDNLMPEYLSIYLSICARGVIVIVVGNGHGDTSSNPRRG